MPSLLELYEKLKPKLGEEEARSLLEFIESSIERRAATKDDLERAMAELRQDVQRPAMKSHRAIAPSPRKLTHPGPAVPETLRRTISLEADLKALKYDFLLWNWLLWVYNIAALTWIMVALLH